MMDTKIVECKSFRDMPVNVWGYGKMPVADAASEHRQNKRGPVDTVYVLRGQVYLMFIFRTGEG